MGLPKNKSVLYTSAKTTGSDLIQQDGIGRNPGSLAFD